MPTAYANSDLTVFLSDLFRYRTRQRQHSEDYLSTCLAELMRRDQVACRVVLEAVGLEPPEVLRPRLVHTQFRFPEFRDVPDILIRVGSGTKPWRAVIECKVESPPDLDQIDRYARHVRACALLATDAQVAALGPKWNGIVRGSWQDIHRRLLADGSRLDPDAVPRLRLEFLHLLEHFGLAGLPHLPASAVEAGLVAQRRIGDLGTLLKHGVMALVPELPYAEWETASESPDWEKNGLDVSWAADRAPNKDISFEGLGLKVNPGAGAGDDLLEWTLFAWPTTAARRRCAALLRDESGWVGLANEWWYLPIADSGDPEAPFRDQLEQVVQASRRILAADFGVHHVKGPVDLPAGQGTEPVPAVLHAVRRVSEVDAALHRWSQRLRELVYDGLTSTLTAGSVRWRKGRRRVCIAAHGREGDASTWHDTGDEPHVGLWLFVPGGRKHMDSVAARLARRKWPEGTRTDVNRRWGTFHLIVPAHHVEALTAEAARTFAANVAAEWKGLFRSE